MATTRIPRTIIPMNNYLSVIIPYLSAGTPTNAERLGIETEEVKQLNDYYKTWVVLYALYIDKTGARTTAVTDQLHQLIDDIVNYDQEQHLLDRIASSLNATVVDLSTFNIGSRSRSNVKAVSKSISELVQPILTAISGGVVSVKCYNNESSRPAILSSANCLQYAYSVGTAPASALDDSLSRDISTRASFNLPLGADKSGKQLYIYFRWYNTIRPELSGPWCSVQAIWLN